MKRIFLWAFAAILILPSAPRAEYKTHKKGPVGISGWVIFWDQGNKSLGDFEKHADQMDRAYFEWYKCEKDGMPHLIVVGLLIERAVTRSQKLYLFLAYLNLGRALCGPFFYFKLLLWFI